MDDRQTSQVEVAPMHADGELRGFLLVGRWPNNPVEWTQFLMLAVRTAAIPGLLHGPSTVFRVVEEVPEGAPERSVGVVMAEGHLEGDDPLRPGQFADPTPHGLAVLHPPNSTVASVPEYQTASGCIFLPGLPHLGLEHQAAWIEADAGGTVTRLATKVGVEPDKDADTAALAMLLAA